jgi:hypothetical protein
MRSLAFAVVVVVAVVACSGSKPKNPDGGNKCTGLPYDSCNTEHDCMSADCHPFTTIQVCTVGCSTTQPCPNDSTGAPGTCTAMGICQPAAANACHL